MDKYIYLFFCDIIYLVIKLRVISGKYKGKFLKGFDINGTRPTMDRVKESMFAMIQNKIKNSICLDLFSGSGSLGIECISNYSSKTYMVDNNDYAIKIIKDNLYKINDKYELLNMDYLEALLYFKNKNIKFDIIILDPPYKSNTINNSLNFIYKYDLLNENGIIIVEFQDYSINSNFKECKHKKYGVKEVSVLTK